MSSRATGTKRASKQIPRRPDRSRIDRRRNHERSLAEGWRDLPWAMRILRAFLGVTFLFAGIQKLFDPNFLAAGSSTFVGNQLHGFAQGTPAGPLLSFLDKAPVLAGVGIALLEIAIGLGTLLGVALVASIVGGVAISLTLWLSATWHVHPYFLGSDSVYTVAWLALLAGDLQAERARIGHVPGPVEVVARMDRRQILRGGVVAGMTLGVAALAKAFAGPLASMTTDGRVRARGGTAGSTGQTGATGSGSGGTPSVGGRTITTLDRLPVGKAIGFTAPGVGAAVLLRLATDRVVAYSRTCTHAGCLVGYDSSSRILFCPCHGAEFDPARGAAPIAGPAPTALQTIRVEVDPQTGAVFLPP